jgi:DNA segregation ATPase FtsK/SpoIIIE-like protein
LARRSSKTTSAPQPWSLGGRRREILWAVVWLTSLFALASLAGWHEGDPTWMRPRLDGVVVGNPCGPLGANVADLLFRAVGVGAWAVVLGLIVPVLALADRQLASLPQWGMAGWVYVVTLALAELGLGGAEELTWRPGGRVGALVSGAMVDVVGTLGAWLALLAAFVGAASLLAGISWSIVADRAVHRAEAEWPAVRERLSSAGGTVTGVTLALLASTASLCWRLLGALVRGLHAAMLGGAGAAISGVERLGAALRLASVRMWRSLAQGRAGATVDASEWEDITGLSLPEASDAGLEMIAESSMDATQVSAGGPFDDVDWEGEPEAEAVSDVLGMFPQMGRRRSGEARGGVAVLAPRPVSRRVPVVTPAAQVKPAAQVTPAPRVAPMPSAPARPPARPPVPPRVEVSNGGPDAPWSDEAWDEAEDTEETYDSPDDPPDEDFVPPARQTRPTPSSHDEAGSHTLHVEMAQGLDDAPPDDGSAVSDRGSLYFQLPMLSLLDPVPEQRAQIDEQELVELARTVEESLGSFKVTGKVTNVRVGPVVTTFEFLPDAGISVRRIQALQDDLAMALKALSVRVVAPIPGKGVVGIEVPSKHRMTIYLREVLASEAFRKHKGALPVVLGKDVENVPMVEDLAKMPHLLVGGTTGSGKSVGVNAIIMSLLFTKTPDELRMLLVDPKKLEFEAYSDTPHLLHPVVTDPKGASAALAWACREMDRRYELLARWKTRGISNYNRKVERESRSWTRDKAIRFAPRGWTEGDPLPQPETLPYIVIVIDELADLMMVAKKDVQDSIVRLAQMARACGMHLIIATQRPSVDVITGLIKSNLPTRIAFKLRSVIDSRTILDQGGAEKLLGMGDMLHLPGAGEVRRCHAPFVSDDEVGRVIEFLRAQREPEYLEEITRDPEEGIDDEDLDGDLDPLYDDAVNIVLGLGKASTSMVQRHLKIGYNRAARIVDSMERMGVVGPADGARPREVLMGPNAG